MRLFVSSKDILRCPQCGATYFRHEGVSKCRHDDSDLILESEYICRKPVIECPYCHSRDTKKITTTSKVVHTALFGNLTTGKNLKEWHCNRCNSDF